jgi:hypothetical protein
MAYMLTTSDNPYDPFTSFDAWLAFDEAQGYFTTSFLARIVRTSDELSEADQSLAIDQAIDEIVEENVLGIYQKVTEGDIISPSPSPAPA